MIKANLLEDIPADTSEEIFESILSKKEVRIERIISHGHITPEKQWYVQDEDEFVLLVTGNASIKYGDGSTVNLTKGEYLYIPALTKHKVSYTDVDEISIWLAIFFKTGK